MYDITASIVTYKNDIDILKKAITSFLNTKNLSLKLYVVDNSPSDKIKSICADSRIKYVFNNQNIGFGAAHNIVLKAIIDNSKYHLVLNPDIYFTEGTLEGLYSFMEQNGDIGQVMPKILNLDGSVQYLCRLIPSAFDLILRRFNSKIIKFIFKSQYEKHELRFTGYNKIMDVPYLSGCFMFIKNEVFKKVGFFDEMFFMYLEDVDFLRRIGVYFRTVYYPKVFVFHKHEKGSYRNLKLLKYHISSAIKYFNKWGWFFDKERRNQNLKALKLLILNK